MDDRFFSKDTKRAGRTNIGFGEEESNRSLIGRNCCIFVKSGRQGVSSASGNIECGPSQVQFVVQTTNSGFGHCQMPALLVLKGIVFQNAPCSLQYLRNQSMNEV